MLKASVIGNLGSDPELRYSPDGRAFLRLSVGCTHRVRDQQGEWQDKTEWVRATVFGQQAERLSQHLRKGTRVYADGRLEARPWTDQQGQPRAGLELVANDVQFMSPRVEEGHTDAPAANPPTWGGGSRRMPAMAAAVGYRQGDDVEPEDLPF